MKPRKLPKSPKTGDSVPEKSRSPFRGAEHFGGSLQEADLFGWARPKAERTVERKEAAALVEVLQALRTHAAVAWCERMNSGAVRVGKRFLRFGWRGCPDVLGQLRDGRLLGVEVKSPTGTLRQEQRIFLQRVKAAGGVAFVARDCRDVLRELNALSAPGQPSRFAS